MAGHKRGKIDKAQYKKASQLRKKKGPEGNEHLQEEYNKLGNYLSIIGDFNTKLFKPDKYPDISESDREIIDSIATLYGFEDYEKSKL